MRKPRLKEFDLEVGKTYQVVRKNRVRTTDKMKEVYDYTGKFIDKTEHIALFDDGIYKHSEMIKDYGIDWRIK